MVVVVGGGRGPGSCRRCSQNCRSHRPRQWASYLPALFLTKPHIPAIVVHQSRTALRHWADHATFLSVEQGHGSSMDSGGGIAGTGSADDRPGSEVTYQKLTQSHTTRELIRDGRDAPEVAAASLWSRLSRESRVILWSLLASLAYFGTVVALYMGTQVYGHFMLRCTQRRAAPTRCDTTQHDTPQHDSTHRRGDSATVFTLLSSSSLRCPRARTITPVHGSTN